MILLPRQAQAKYSSANFVKRCDFFSCSVTDTRNREINVNVLAKCIRSGKVSRVMDPTGEWGIIKIEVFPALNQVDEYHCYKSKAKLPNGCNAHYGLVRTNDWGCVIIISSSSFLSLVPSLSWQNHRFSYLGTMEA